MNASNSSEQSVPTRAGLRRLGLGVAVSAMALTACFPQQTPTTPTTTTIEVVTPDPEPTLTLSKTSGLNAAGDTITVTGSGYDPDAYVGTRPPLAGKPTGVYVNFGKYADQWAPSTGAASPSRQTIVQRWVLPQEGYDALVALGGQNAEQAVLMNEDGSFEFTIDVAPTTTGTNAYGVVSYPGGGPTFAQHEVIERVTFAPRVTADLPEAPVEGQTVNVRGEGFLPSATGTRLPLAGQPAGVYVAWGRFADVWQPSTGAAGSTRTVGSNGTGTVWAMPEPSFSIMSPEGTDPAYALIRADGSFDVTLTVSTIESANPNYGIATYAGSGAKNSEQELFIASAAPAAPEVPAT